MKQFKKWYSLFAVGTILFSTVIQPVQAVVAMTADSETVNESLKEEEGDSDSVNFETTSETTQSSIEELDMAEEATDSTVSKEKESGTEDTSDLKESREPQKRMKTVKEEESGDIRSLLDPSEKFITDMFLTVHDKDNNLLDYTKDAIPADATIKLEYKWALPERLISENLIKPGYFYEIELPDNLELRPKNGTLISDDGKEYGTYEYTSDRKIRWEFNEILEEKHDISGKVSYASSLERDVIAGENIISVPVNKEIETITINVKPNGGTSISKQNIPLQDNRKIRWEVSINTEMDLLENAIVTDSLPKGTSLEKLTVYQQKINLAGGVSLVEAPLVEGKDYKIQGNDVIFIGEYAKTNSSFRIVYDTKVEESAIPYDGGYVKFDNKAILKNGKKEYPDDAEEYKYYAKFLTKSNARENNKGSGHVYDWYVEFNSSEKKLEKGSFIKDTLHNEYLDYIEESIIIKDLEENELKKDIDYTVKIDNTKKEMLITFPNGLDKAVTIDYQTKTNRVIDDSFEDKNLEISNVIESNTGNPAEGHGYIDKNNVVKDGRIDYRNRKIKWEITVNKFKYELQNWSLKDTISEHQTFDKNSFKLREAGNPEPLKEGVDYQLSSKDQYKTFDVIFLGERAKGTSKTYEISYETDFKRREEYFDNTVETTWTDQDGEKHKADSTKKLKVLDEYVADATKDKFYNAQTKRINWWITVNYNQDILENATIVDPIIGNQKLVKESVKVYEAELYENGSVAGLIKEIPNITKIEDEKITVNLPEGSKKVYVLKFETDLDDTVIGEELYENKATYKNKSHEKKVEASIKATNGGSFATKSGSQNGDYVDWNVTINPSQSTLKDVTIVDTPSKNQIIDEQSIKIYGTHVSVEGKIDKNSKEELEQGKDYSVDLKSNNETGQQVLTIKFLKEIDTAYYLEYSSAINSSLLHDTVSNKLAIKGKNEQVISEEISSEKEVVVTGGTAEGSSASVTIVKVDKNSKDEKPLAGAKFELWSESNGKKKRLVRSGETNEKGELRFGNLRAKTNYLLFETQAPEGFTVSKELQEGKVVQFEKDTATKSFEKLVVKNDIPRIAFKKIDSQTKKGIAGATFAIMNQDNRFYNGLDSRYAVKWVDSETQMSKEVKQQLTSDDNGVVKVTGLPVGSYQIKELTPPEGYEVKQQDVPFEVISDAGVIELKSSIPDIENEKIEYLDIPVKKIWEDDQNRDGKRPDFINVTLLENGKETDKTLTLLEANQWQDSFKGLRKYNEKKELINYSIKESLVPAYEKPEIVSKNGGYEIVNKYTPKTTQVKGKKIWKDDQNRDHKRPEKIEVNLWADGKKIDSKETSADQNWEYTFQKLAKYDQGEEIKYTVTETVVPGYSVEINGFDITNHYTPEKTNVTAVKNWEDKNDQDGIRLNSIHVQLYGDNEKIGEEEVLSKSNDWKKQWNNLPLKKNGEVISYTVKEVTELPKGYASSTEEVSKGNFEITNTYVPETTSVEGRKIWKDNDNQDGKRASTIKVNLRANGKTIQSKEVSANDDWKYSFENLPKFEQGKQISYTISEEQISDYQASQDGYDTINTHTPGKVSVPVVKVWEDKNNQDGKRPSFVTVQLWKDGKDTGKSLVLNETNHWQGSFDNLDEYQNGQLIDYQVKEKAVSGYESLVTGDRKTSFVVTNVHTPETTQVSGTKNWEDKDNQDGKRPTSITVKLYANGKYVKEEKVSEKTKWSYTFDQLPKYDKGEAINYTVVEHQVPEYQATYQGNNILNTHTPGKVSVPVIKVWEDNNNQDGKRPSFVTVRLLANGKETKEKLVLSQGTNWQGSFANLDEYQDGKLIDYTIKEETVPAYESSVSGSSKDSYILTNSHEPETTQVSGTKNWEDKDNQDGKRPTSITVNLYADGKFVKETKVTADTNWTYQFKELPKFKEGKPIDYTVTEEKVPGYQTKIKGFDLVNTYTPGKVNIPVKKVWEDAHNQDGIRPTSVEVALVADGKVTDKKVKLSEETNWQGSFDDLDEYQKGKLIHYTIQEVNTKEGYQATVAETTKGNFTIVNNHQPAVTSVKGVKNWEDKDNQDGKRPDEVTIRLYGNGEEKAAKTISKEQNWAYEFTDLPVFEKGQPVNYTVTEDQVSDYQAGYTGFDVTNSYTPGKISIPVTKIWHDQDNQDGIRPEKVTIKLLANGQETTQKIELSAKNNWQDFFTDLAEYEKGKRIEYTVEEEAVSGYESVLTGSTEKGYTVANTHIPETTQIKGSKTWKDKDNQDGKRPTEITLNLLANGKKVDEIIVDKASNWKYQVRDLPKFEKGEKIRYNVQEQRVKSYSATVNGFDVTNHYTPGKTAIDVVKTWQDSNDQNKLRPNEIIVELFADGKKTDKELVLTEETNWQGVFSDLDIYKNGKLIKYTIKEVSILGYEGTITGDAETGFSITNTLRTSSNHSSRLPKTGGKTPSTSYGVTNTKTSKGRLPRTGESHNTNLMGLGLLLLTLVALRKSFKRKELAE
ncbi:Cna B-type domain-containing protein [Vagococcus carniphilus]|uniref:Cna B-type domain-containing protein n=1 Tax=Vagococcus carniphilus TaxID=218144 RepID=UPI002891E69C|nr:Cna B-type domain-containing protein [Vagococcus carniphilus]MDT2831297.1 Cna B-type domain-containing protein [Vagococcus carniphilus]MDT2840369.1 Cna B-type domain-containing protein [Vagococcus carniphilus]MDT2854874.1 Cna B-type domain-containing protein [Vagococcus carniphilus]